MKTTQTFRKEPVLCCIIGDPGASEETANEGAKDRDCHKERDKELSKLAQCGLPKGLVFWRKGQGEGTGR